MGQSKIPSQKHFNWTLGHHNYLLCSQAVIFWQIFTICILELTDFDLYQGFFNFKMAQIFFYFWKARNTDCQIFIVGSSREATQ